MADAHARLREDNARLRTALSRIVAECGMSREQFIMQGPAFACRQVERAVGIALTALAPKDTDHG